MRVRSLLVHLAFGCICAIAMAGIVAAQDADKARDARLKYFKTRLAEFAVSADNGRKMLSNTPKPVLRWTNPVLMQSYDGVVFLWLDGKTSRNHRKLFR